MALPLEPTGIPPAPSSWAAVDVGSLKSRTSTKTTRSGLCTSTRQIARSAEQQVAAHLGSDLRGLEGELLVRALGLHLKGADLPQFFSQVFLRRPAQMVVHLLFHHTGTAQRGETEDVLQPVSTASSRSISSETGSAYDGGLGPGELEAASHRGDGTCSS